MNFLSQLKRSRRSVMGKFHGKPKSISSERSWPESVPRSSRTGKLGVANEHFDWMPFQKGRRETGVPATQETIIMLLLRSFWCWKLIWPEPFCFSVQELEKLDIEFALYQAGSPYYKPAIFSGPGLISSILMDTSHPRIHCKVLRRQNCGNYSL